MSTLTTARTLADVISELGVAPDRILASPPIGTATEADLIRIVESGKRLAELVDGTIVEKAMGFEESIVAQRIAYLLISFVVPRNLGVIAGSDGMVRLLAGIIRMADVAYVSWDRFPNRRLTGESVAPIAPDIAVEVLSRSNTDAEMLRKRREYFEATTHLVWLVDHRERTVAVYTSIDEFVLLHESDTLDGGSVLPEFSVPVREIFSDLDRHG